MNKETQQKELAENLQFMRSAVEKTHKKIKPYRHDAIMWGLICATTYISIHFLIKHQLYKWIGPLYLSLMGLGMCCSFITLSIWFKRQKKLGFIPMIAKQIVGIWMIILVPIIFWDRMGLFNNIFCGSGFIYAMALGILLGILGILYSKEWLLGSVMIFVGTVLAFFVKDYAFIILGVATGTGFIIPAIIVQINYRKREKNHE